MILAIERVWRVVQIKSILSVTIPSIESNRIASLGCAYFNAQSDEALDLDVVIASLDSVPPHQPRRGPVGGDGFDQIAPRMFGQKGDALGLAGCDRQRIQPERFPAIVEPVQQPEMMAVEVEYGGDGGAVGQRQHHGAARWA
jgi:hypothetical protein